jgi:hypothetical protein
MTRDEPKRLYIVTVAFDFPALLTETEAAHMKSIDHMARDALSDLGDSPIDGIVPAGPDYRAPHGYDDGCLVYGPRNADVTWRQAVDADKLAEDAARLLSKAPAEEPRTYVEGFGYLNAAELADLHSDSGGRTT